jgi:hypothetical protein
LQRLFRKTHAYLLFSVGWDKDSYYWSDIFLVATR